MGGQRNDSTKNGGTEILVDGGIDHGRALGRQGLNIISIDRDGMSIAEGQEIEIVGLSEILLLKKMIQTPILWNPQLVQSYLPRAKLEAEVPIAIPQWTHASIRTMIQTQM